MVLFVHVLPLFKLRKSFISNLSGMHQASASASTPIIFAGYEANSAFSSHPGKGYDTTNKNAREKW